jgi:hypothetical protein
LHASKNKLALTAIWQYTRAKQTGAKIAPSPGAFLLPGGGN